MRSMNSMRIAVVALAAAFVLAGCGAGGGGGGGPVTPTATLAVTPLAFSSEADQSVTITPTVTNIATPAYTFELVPPASMTRVAATPAEIADKFGTLTAGVFKAGPNATVGLRGSIIVTETSHHLTATVPLVIVPFVDHVTIDPTVTSLLANQSRTFTATAFDVDSNPIADVLVDYRVTGGIGSINAAGLFLARNAGEGTVTAKVGGADAAVSSVTVVGSVTGLSIRPAGNPIQVEAGTQRQFKAFVTDASNNETQVTATWEATAATGTITAAGLFTASATVGASGTLTARYSGQTASLPLTVVALVTPPAGPYNVRGLVSTSGGTPAAGALVEVRVLNQTPVIATVTTSTDGTYRLWLPAGTYDLTATLGASTAQSHVALPTQDIIRTSNLQLTP
ncbi:MAG: carboxypeptidase regulatory-like domain-containing protein [Armatimonadetes bacterium]|nr:carboxypeptidase regulatory-like domain-containing protein [Armatimonadota bacterium]